MFSASLYDATRATSKKNIERYVQFKIVRKVTVPGVNDWEDDHSTAEVPRLTQRAVRVEILVLERGVVGDV